MMNMGISMNDTAESLSKEFVALLSRVEKRIAYLKSLEEECERQWQFMEDERKRREKLVEDNLALAQEQIKLDVGGKVFTTSKKTLLAQKDTYFYAMLSSGRWEQKEGSYFIDRDPLHFDRILNFLRTGEFLYEGLYTLDLMKIRDELDYYLITVPNFTTYYVEPTAPDPPLQLPSVTPNTQTTPSQLQWCPDRHGSNLQLSADCLTVTKSRGANEWDAAALGDGPVTKFTVKISIREKGGIMIGMAPWFGFNTNGEHYATTMHCVNVKNRSMYGPNSTRASVAKMQTGSTVTVSYDKDRKEISYSVDGNKPVVGHTNVTGELFPAVVIANVNASLTILHETPTLQSGFKMLVK